MKPFIVAFWGQANQEPIPTDLLPLYQASPRGGSNVRCFVLGPDGDLRHSFNGFPGNAANPLGFAPEAYVEYFTGEIARGVAGLKLPKVEPALKLPEAKDGVRLFIRVPGAPGAYGYPVVETVENRDEWKTLAYPESPRRIEASHLSRWLRLSFPPGVNEQLHPFGVVKGTLTLKPAGKQRAILSGPIKMAKTENDYDLFEGTFEAVLTYGAGTTLRGAVDGIYWRYEPRRQRWMDWKLTAAVESRPE